MYINNIILKKGKEYESVEMQKCQHIKTEGRPRFWQPLISDSLRNIFGQPFLMSNKKVTNTKYLTLVKCEETDDLFALGSKMKEEKGINAGTHQGESNSTLIGIIFWQPVIHFNYSV